MKLRTTDVSRAGTYVEETRMEAHDGLLKMDMASPRKASEATAKPSHGLIFRGGEGASITVINHRDQSYSVIDQQSIEDLGTEMRLRMQATDLQVESLPPEQREVVRRMLDSQLGKVRSAPRRAPGTVVRTRERATVSGWVCTKYEVFQAGKKLREVWVAPIDEIQDGEPALAILSEMSDFYTSLIDSVEQAAPGFGAGFRLAQHPFEDLRRMDGFPVLTRNFVGGRARTEVLLLSVEESPPPATTFGPPEGYTREVAN